jgi:DNA-binding GntR family transcriptional regulator
MESNLKVNLNEYLPLRDVVFNSLRAAILKGELEPGERLMEKQLADKMGVSRTPIREAIRKLELEGLVVMIPRKGAEVANISEKDIRNVLEVRAALEGLAVKLACRKMDTQTMEKLKKLRDELKVAAVENEVDKIIRQDIEFHDLIFNSTDNEKLIQIINNLREQIYLFRVRYIKELKNFESLINEHDSILDSIINHDEELAEKMAVQHIHEQEKVILELFK